MSLIQLYTKEKLLTAHFYQPWHLAILHYVLFPMSTVECKMTRKEISHTYLSTI